MKVGSSIDSHESMADSYTGMLSAFMAFIEPGDEVIIFEPFFDIFLIVE